MRLPGLSSSSIMTEEHGLRRFVWRNLEGIAGLVMVAAAAALSAALATWTIDDPSLSHATDGPVRNALGFPGATISDLLMQVIGLAAMCLPLILAVWGTRLVFRRHYRFGRRHLWSWIVGTLLFAGALAAVSPSAGLAAAHRLWRPGRRSPDAASAHPVFRPGLWRLCQIGGPDLRRRGGDLVVFRYRIRSPEYFLQTVHQTENDGRRGYGSGRYSR